MIGTRQIAFRTCLALAPSLSALGQSAPTPQAPLQCAELLTAPTRDSVLLRVLLTVHAFDRERDLPPSMQFDFGEAIRKHLVLPQPLGADAYESSGDASRARTAHLTLHGNYAATITADGHVVDAVAIGGARNPDFDRAVLAAMGAIDSTDQLSVRDAGMPKEDIGIRIEISARDSTHTASGTILGPVLVSAIRAVGREAGMNPPLGLGYIPPFPSAPPDSEQGLPLFRFRVPVRPVTNVVAVMPGTAVRYPKDLRQPGMQGQAEVAFVVNSEGRAEQESIQVVNATQRDFAEAALDAVRHFQFRPLAVNGCAVRALAEQPFHFFVAR